MRKNFLKKTVAVMTVSAMMVATLAQSAFAADKATFYFVDCGDINVNTVAAGESLGLYNSVTEQVYGKDAKTGKKWGIVDTVTDPLKNGKVDTMSDAVFTDITWPHENGGWTDDSKATETNRYTKNQFETGVDRNLHYAFELEDGKYTVEMFFADPWGCSKNAIVTAEGTKMVDAAAVGEAVSFDVEVKDGELTLDITAPAETLCINLAYIKVIGDAPEGVEIPKTGDMQTVLPLAVVAMAAAAVVVTMRKKVTE